MEDRQQVGIVATVRRAAVGRVPVDLQTLHEAAEVLVLAAKAAQVVQGLMGATAVLAEVLQVVVLKQFLELRDRLRVAAEGALFLMKILTTRRSLGPQAVAVEAGDIHLFRLPLQLAQVRGQF